MNKSRKQSDTTYPLFFLMVDSTDHVTGKTGLSPTVTISKNGGSFASPSGAVSEVGNGLYKVAGNATDSNTVGELWIHATGSGADPTDTAYTVVAYDPFDAVRLGLTALPNAAAEAAGGLYTRGSGAGQINQPANGQIDANTVKVSGTTQTARDIGASVLLSSGTGAGQISLSAGAVLLQATQTGVTIPTVTNLTNAPTSGDLTATMKTSVTTAATAATPTVTVSGIVTANVTQIDGSATNGNNAVLKLKSLDIRSNDIAVSALDIRGADGSPGANGGKAVNILGGSSGTGGSAGADGIYAAGGGGTSTRGYGLHLAAPNTGQSGLWVEGNSTEAAKFSGYNGVDIYANIVGNLTGSVGSLDTQAKADVNAEVKDVMETDTQAEPTGVPAAASSFKEKIGWIFLRLRNKQTLTKASGVEKIYADNSVTQIGTSTDTDDGSTFTKGKAS